MKNKFSKFTADTSFEIVQECIDDKTDHQNNCIHVFCLQFSVALETVKIVSMIRNYTYHKPQTTPWHREEEPSNHHETPGRQIKQSNQLSLPHQDDCNTRMYIK